MKFVKVYFCDDSHKTLPIQRTTTAQQLVEAVAEKLGLEHEVETFCLFEVRAEKERFIHKEEIPFEIYSVWGNDKSSKFLFKKRYFMTPNKTPEKETDLHMLYIQSHADVLKGEISCTEQEAITFAGLHAQISFGDHSSRHSVGFLTRALHDYVPSPLFRNNDPQRWEELIYEEHKKLLGKSSTDCMKDFLAKCREYTSFGHVTFPVKWASEGARRVNLRVIIAVGVGGISILRIPGKERIHTHPFNDILSWGCSASTFAFTIGDPETISAGIAENRKFTFETRQGSEIASAVQGHVDLLIARLSREDDLVSAEEPVKQESADDNQGKEEPKVEAASEEPTKEAASNENVDCN